MGLPLREITLPGNPSNQEYEARMEDLLAEYKERGVSRVVFGDVFLEDVREYRERNLARVGFFDNHPCDLDFHSYRVRHLIIALSE